MEQTRRIRFVNTNAEVFAREVRARVAAFFESSGRSRHADWRMGVKTVILLSLTFGSYGLIMSGRFPLMAMWALTFLMGVGIAGIGFSIAHDALHGAYSSRRWLNTLLGFTFDLIGANGYVWNITHNVIHHTYTNIHGVDEDLTVSPLLRLSPGARRYWFHRYQHLYGFLAYGFATVNWLFVKDYQQCLKSDIGPYVNKKHPAGQIAILILCKLLAVTWMIVLPLAVLDITRWQFLIGFLTAHVTAGVILGVVFQLAHVVEGPEFPMPDDEGDMEYPWIAHQMRTTADFAAGNRALTWYVGGLNYQIEHHLFPQTCSIHYPAIARIVREVAEEHGLPYHYTPTLRAAIGSHYRMLKRLGSDPRTDEDVPPI